MTDVTMLGTSCMVPTKDRNVSGIYIESKGTGILFDCGEGTQRQMNIAGINRNKVRYVFISHWHADHISGLLGLIQTIGNSQENPTLDIYGPKGTKKHFDCLIGASIFQNNLAISVHELDIKEVTQVLKTSVFTIFAAPMSHGVPCVGYSFVENDTRRVLFAKLQAKNVPEGPHLAKLQSGEDISYEGNKISVREYTKLIKGNKFTYIPDTEFTENAIELAKDSEVLVSEATFTEEHKEKAEGNAHMTAAEAAQIASMSGSKKLLLNHFSQRYKTTEVLLEEAKIIFPDTEIAFDFMTFKL